MQKIIIKSFHGIGDLLFSTPSFRVIKESYPNIYLIVNTHKPGLLKNNPFVDKIGSKREGLYPNHPDPAGNINPRQHNRIPYQHHILSHWEIICKAYDLKTRRPAMRPELYIRDLPPKRNIIGVQVRHRRRYHSKRVWPYFEELSRQKGFEAIPNITSGDIMVGIVKKVFEYKNIVCAEGGLSHIRAALGLPAVVLMGGFTSPDWTGYPDHINLVSNIECRYCYNKEPCRNDFKCWGQFSLEYVKGLVS